MENLALSIYVICGLILFRKYITIQPFIQVVALSFMIVTFSGSMQAVGLAAVGVIAAKGVDHKVLVSQLHEAMYGAGWKTPELERASIKKVRIDHVETDLITSTPVVVRRSGEQEFTYEERYCLDSWLPEHKTTSFRLLDTKRSPSMNELYTFFHKGYYTEFGGTGLNKGQFYGVQGSGIKWTTANEAIAYLSLLKTPLAVDKDGKPYAFDMKVLVISDKEMREICHLVPGNNTLLMNKKVKIQGQFRLLHQEGTSTAVGKGAACFWDQLTSLKLKDGSSIVLPEEYFNYDMVISESNIKVGSMAPEAYNNVHVGFTYDNTWTVDGGPVGHSFELYEFIKFNKKVLGRILEGVKLGSLDHILFGETKGKVIAAAKAGEPYSPPAIDTAIQRGYLAFGASYPAVNESLQKKVLRELINNRIPETSMKLVLMVTDDVDAIDIVKNHADGIVYKFPITAGLAKVRIPQTCVDLFWWAICETTCELINTDGDGDVDVVQRGPITDYILRKNLIKPLRSLAVNSSTGKEAAPMVFSLANLAKNMARILGNNGVIGQLTDNGYRLDIANEVGLEPNSPSMDPYTLGIELVIKSNKKPDLDLSIIDTRNKEQEKALRGLISMGWKEKRWAKDMDGLFKSGADVLTQVGKFSDKHRIADPLHYMDFIWNYCLDRTPREIENIKSMQRPLKWFAKLIEPQIIEDQEAYDLELALLKKANYIFNNCWTKGQPFFGKASAITTILESLEVGTAAVAEHVKSLLTNSTGKGMFPLYLKSLTTVIDGGIKTVVKDNAIKTAKAIASIFGEVDNVKQAISGVGNPEVTIWRGRNGLEGRTIIPAEMIVDTEVTVYGKAVTGFNASVNGNIMDGKYLVVKSTDKFNKNGSICETGISVTLQRVA